MVYKQTRSAYNTSMMLPSSMYLSNNCGTEFHDKHKVSLSREVGDNWELILCKMRNTTLLAAFVTMFLSANTKFQFGTEWFQHSTSGHCDRSSVSSTRS